MNAQATPRPLAFIEAIALAARFNSDARALLVRREARPARATKPEATK